LAVFHGNKCAQAKYVPELASDKRGSKTTPGILSARICRDYVPFAATLRAQLSENFARSAITSMKLIIAAQM
jgi:hypothetical protein